MRQKPINILFVGESWLGSCARSLKEALNRLPDVIVDELAEDVYAPKGRRLSLRMLHKVLRPIYRKEFNERVLEKARFSKPDVFVTYKGHFIHADLIQSIKSMGIKTINIYPDCSAFAHGAAHRKAVGAYDLVISTKIYHKDIWHTQYGYTNQCLFVPQGYDPALHLNQSSPSQFRFDVVLIATYREEYGRLIMEFASSLGHNALRVAIGGYGWEALRQNLPRDWTFTGPMQAASYVSLLRSGKICVAPLTRTVIIDGKQHLGDVDTTRTYELPAAHCFFIHQRTDYAMSLYGDAGVPMFDDGVELANQVKLYLNDDAARVQIASAAHRAAVPAHSLDSRAQEIVDIMRREIVT